METRWHHRRSATRPAYFLGRPTSRWILATGPRAGGPRRDDDRVNAGRKLTLWHRLKIDPPGRVGVHAASSVGTLPRSRSLSR